MKTVRSLFLVALLVASAFADCVTRDPVDVFVGDDPTLDSVLACSGQLQSVALPVAQLGGTSGLTFEVEVYARAFTGCVFTYGSGADLVQLKFIQDPNNGLGQVWFTVGSASVNTQGVLLKNQWHNLAVVVSNNALVNGASNGATATIYIDGVAFPAGAVGAITSNTRSGSLGFCSTDQTYLNAAIDNLIITAAVKTVQQLSDTHTLIFPWVLQNDLVQMWTFNDDGAYTTAFTGNGASNVAQALLNVAAGSSAACSRVPKTGFAGAKVTDIVCTHAGNVAVTAGSTAANPSNVANYQGTTGLSTTFGCAAGAAFTFNQKWSNGGIIEVTVKTSLNHRFRIGTNVNGPLLVDHQSWGGYTRLATGTGIIAEDRSGYSISETAFSIQAAGIGWLTVTQAGGFLNFQYALDSNACPEATCNFLTAQQFQYDFANPPLPEPMGNLPTAEGIQNLPPVLACPTPKLTGYNPFMYCWGWWVGPQVGYTRDWNGNQWQTSDPGCCDNAVVTSSSQIGAWSFNAWGYLVQGKTLPWCDNLVVPPIAPPKPATSLPTYPTNPCADVAAADLANYQATCAGLWGSDQTDGRYVGCVAQLCITQDPTTVPPPDCRTEKLLASLDYTHTVPSTCNSCPNSCNFGNGVCNTATFVCTCNAGWTGSDCSQPVKYPCLSVNGNKLQAVPLYENDPNHGNPPVLTITMSNPLYTQFYFPYKYYISDTLIIYLAQTTDTYNGQQNTYHLWAVSGDGRGTVDVDYTVSITASTFGASSSSVDMFGGASPLAGIGPVTSTSYPSLARAVNANTVSLRIAHKASAQAGFVIRNLPANFASTITVTATSASTQRIPQVLVAGASASAKAVLDVVKVSAAQLTSGFTLGGSGAGGATTCDASTCGAILDCASCAANTACGWCVETAQCQPGSASGPGSGECLNWRYSFAAGSRRVTQIPAFPVNPGLTEVVINSGAAADLPIQVSLTPAPYQNTEWDLAVLVDFGSVSQDTINSQIQPILTSASNYPNLGIAFASIYNGLSIVQPIVNPRATDSVPQLLANSVRAAATNGPASVSAAITALAAPTDAFSFRPGARKIALFICDRDWDQTVAAVQAAQQALLIKNVMPVFAVPASVAGSYQTIVNTLGFGYVSSLARDNLNTVVDAAMRMAGSNINILIPTAEQVNANSLIDYTGSPSSFATNIDQYSVINLPTSFRAMFTVPVKAGAGVSLTTSNTAHLVFPGYGTALVENLPNPLQDAPWTTADAVLNTNDAAGPQLIELTGMSFRGLMAITPKVLTVTNTAVGDLYFAVRQDVAGVPTWVQGGLITGPQVVADGKIVFVPKAAGSTSFTYGVNDMCLASAPGTINIVVASTDKPPVADMPNMVTPQYTPLEFTLGYFDDNMATGGQYTFTITQTVAPADGALYSYYPGFDPANPQVANLVTSGQSFTNSNVARFIYMPPQYKYSDATLPQLLALPCFNYKVTETSPGSNLVSNEKQVLITITHVNVPPFVWDDASWPSTLFPAANPDANGWPTVDASWCKDSCTFLEDFGEQYWWNTGFEYIYLGGDDIQGSDLTYQLSNIDCFPGTTLLIPLDNTRNAVVGDQIARNVHGTLNPTLRFRPARETSDVNRASLDGAAYYCQIQYFVINEYNQQSSTKTITINITPVNKQPRLDQEVTHIVALEQQKQQFFLSAVDPEGDAFVIAYQGCVQNQGVIELCANVACLTTVAIDCSNVYNPLAPVSYPITGVAAGEQVDGLTAPIQGFFTSGPVATFAQGNAYNTIYFTFADTPASTSTFPATVAEVIFDVKVVNNAPVLTIQQQQTDTYSTTSAVDVVFTPAYFVQDADFVGEAFYVMTLDVTFDNTQASNASLNVADLQPLMATYDTCQDGLIVTSTQIHITCGIDSINEVLAKVAVVAPYTLLSNENGLVVLKATVNDNGFVGQCDVPYITNAPCPLTSTVSANIQYVVNPKVSMTTVATSSAAAGVAGAAAIAAVALFRKFNQKAEESYHPWDNDVNDDSTAVNPLYQASGNSGENPLFEAKGDL